MKSLTNLLSDWRAARARMEKLAADTPRIIGVESVRIVKQNFQLQEYDSGIGGTQWPARAAKTNKAYDRRGQYKGSVYNSSSKLLLQTRNLFRNVRFTVIGKNVQVGVNLSLVPYAKIQNEGGHGIPARKFIPANGEPPNRKILKAVVKKIVFERDRAMKDFKT